MARVIYQISGFLKLLPGDAVYSCLTSSSSSGLDDVAVCWLGGRCASTCSKARFYLTCAYCTRSELFSDDIQHRATEVRDRILGPRELRTRNMPQGIGSERTGGTLFERDFPPHENVRGGRCYPFGTSFEFIPKYYAPCAQGKQSRAGSDVLSYRSDLLKVCRLTGSFAFLCTQSRDQISLEMASRSLLASPQEVGECLHINHELLNIPSVGTSDNTFFGACQLNIAPANSALSGEGSDSVLRPIGQLANVFF